MNDILKFQPLYKSMIWGGGERIARFKGADLEDNKIGESWELSPVKGSESIVAGGPWAGRSLPELSQEYGNDIMGERLMAQYGSFPLLIKFIDSREDLSIQVHPDDELAMKRHQSRGKTEMWYCLGPSPEAFLYVGFSRRISPGELREKAENGEIVEYLRRHAVKAGDVFFLPAGTVHSIGRGNFLLEVQEASDITYRLYDHGRLDCAGKPRRLHLEEAVKAINFDDVNGDFRFSVNVEKGKSASLCACPFFYARLNNVAGKRVFDFSPEDSFIVLVATAGDFVLDPGRQNVSLRMGETALVPWSLPRLAVTGQGDLVSISVPG